MASVDGSRSVVSSSDQTGQTVCNPCRYADVHKEASHYCKDCQEYLCKTYADSHKGLKLLRNHVLILVSDLSQQPIQSRCVSYSVHCGCDQYVAATDFCETHEEVICHSCKTILHRKCKTFHINSKSATDETLMAIAERLTRSRRKLRSPSKQEIKILTISPL